MGIYLALIYRRDGSGAAYGILLSNSEEIFYVSPNGTLDRFAVKDTYPFSSKSLTEVGKTKSKELATTVVLIVLGVVVVMACVAS